MSSKGIQCVSYNSNSYCADKNRTKVSDKTTVCENMPLQNTVKNPNKQDPAPPIPPSLNSQQHTQRVRLVSHQLHGSASRTGGSQYLNCYGVKNKKQKQKPTPLKSKQKNPTVQKTTITAPQKNIQTAEALTSTTLLVRNDIPNQTVVLTKFISTVLALWILP